MRKVTNKQLSKPYQTVNKYRRFVNILASPYTKEPLVEQGDRLVTKSGKSYQIVDGIPILVKQPEKMHTTPPPPAKISKTTEKYVVQKEFKSAKTILHLGSGDVECSDPRVISLDILPCKNVDVVGEAEDLPFASNSFDLVESTAVFEHVYDPLAAIAEVKRVLKPGGIFRIDNSFLQPYHGFPGHYYAMTPQANETYLVDDFIMIGSSIPESGTPIMTLSMMIERFVMNLSETEKKRCMKMSLQEFLGLLKSDFTSKNILMKDFSEYEKRSMAATHVIVAKKPVDYDKSLRVISKNPDKFQNWQSLKRQYYTLRTEVMLRYHEIFAYKRFTLDIAPHHDFRNIKVSKPLNKILTPLELKDPFSLKELQDKIKKLKEEEATLVNIRNSIIEVFLEYKERQPKRKKWF